MEESYLTVARTGDLESAQDRFVYRVFEILPGALAWGTFLVAILGSWLLPVWTSFFVIALVIFWLVRTIYLSLHLKAGYQKMREYEKANWKTKLEELRPEEYTLENTNWKDIYHLVVIPAYTESVEILRDTISAIKQSDYDNKKLIVVLGMEERAQESQERAEILKKEFGDTFFRFLVTSHPANIEGELAGKGSNETYATKRAKEEIIDVLSIPYKNIIVSSLDADTVIAEKYFSCLTYHYLTTEDPLHTSFQPIPLFTNNIWQAPAISRIFAFSSTFWHTMNQQRPEKLVTFSSHSMSFQALVGVGFKQVNVVSDDSRIFWQCLLHYEGRYYVQPLSYPLSMDANVGPNLKTTIVNMYKQQRRWAYGAENIPYFFFGLWKGSKVPLRRKIALGWELIEGNWSWSTASILIFALGWLPLFLGGTEFSQTLLSYNLPRFISWILTISMLGLITSIYLSLRLLPTRPASYGRKRMIVFVLQWALLPVSMVFFALPSLEAQTRLMFKKYLGFWTTPKYRDEVTPSEASL